ncbi:MFS transporter [Pseudomonas sp. FME51]|uniref:MFS transporter n=1 Tax=Pseudomonas sp. FME51 TaxID=2742609 RepID=UPI001866C47A|nr:MFS transporter [Pseudomonas sp. FME51]
MQSNWRVIFLIYAFGLSATSALGMMGPIVGDIGAAFDVSGQTVGFAIAGQLLPLAFAGVLMGWLIDKLGPRPLLGLGVSIIALCSLINAHTQSFTLLRATLLLEGIALVALLTAGQGLLMIITKGTRQIKAMTLWSTVMPVGYALGLLLVSPFAGSDLWQRGFLVHGLIFLALACSCVLLPKVRLQTAPGGSLAVLRNRKVVRFGAALSMSALAGIGTSAVGALYLHQVHGVALAFSAQIMATASLAGVLGSVLVGLMLTRGWQGLSTALLVVLVALLGGVAFYVPWGFVSLATAGAVLLQVAVGGFIALTYALMPRTLSDPAMAGTAAGLVGQITGIGATLSAPLFFSALAQGQWVLFLVIVAMAWIGSLLVLPVWSQPRTGEALA